ncbi:MAG: hypothetical protein ACK5XR_21055, partial [Pseudanabaena sp.]
LATNNNIKKKINPPRFLQFCFLSLRKPQTGVGALGAATRFWVLIRYKLQIARNVGAFIFALILLM